MKAMGYCRVSSQEQTEGTSLNVQQEQIETYAKLKGIDLVAVYQDPAVSGGKPLSARPEGARLIESLEQGEAGIIIITKLDRAFRNTVDCLQTVSSWKKLDVALHIIDMGGNSIDTTSSAGEFMLTVLAAAAQMERKRITERCNEGRKARRAQGRRIGAVPYGYTLAHDGKTLLKDPTQQKALSVLLCLRQEGYSLRNIAHELNSAGFPAKQGGLWTYGQIQSVLATIRRSRAIENAA